MKKIKKLFSALLAGMMLFGVACGDGHTHDYATRETTKFATCTEDGAITCTCECGATKTIVITAAGHDYVKGVCAVCGDTAHEAMTIAQARAAEEGAYVEVEGVVASITYAYGMVPSGVYLVDDTQSIYVYGGELAASVSVGNKIKVQAQKTYWILEDEQASAAKFGYKGCNQLENPTLVSKDGGKYDFDKSWITESTVKAIVDTPVTQDITTTIYKVNAYVKKVQGPSFVNYYINDLDGETGNYVYTQCNGGDFAWLDEFDGKICTVYLSPINAKSASGACFFRFLPIEVKDEGFTFDANDAGKLAVDCYGVDQFESVYYADPAKEMTTSVDLSLFSISGVTLSYASSNTSVLSFATEGGKTVMHTGSVGKATVTVTGKYGSYAAYEKTVEVEVKSADAMPSITVAQAITTEQDTEITVKGIVGPSLVNQSGFYLFGDDGSMIAVKVGNVSELAGVEIGHTVVLKGRRERYVKEDTSTNAGQTCIVDADILFNLYGNTAYSDAKFVTDKTVADFYALDSTVDYSTTVFVLKATVTVTGGGYSTGIVLTSGSDSISLYCSGAGQYEWLQAYAGQEVTLEVAACNWNDKSYWRGCVLAVRLSDGTKVYNTLNFDNN
ncbi:MAG: hypothetical protein IJX81_03715 [Clostridia bacterium]|nr:hypothetical protein [Clostridia bacterium]